MLTRHLTSKIIDIRLEEEKFYFPGETIKGLVIVHPKSAIKVNLIQLKFSGQVYVHLKEKETSTLFQNTLVLAVDQDNKSKQTILDASEHTFPFQFIVPKNLNLPSSMEFGKKGHIRYTINALLDRPMLPESLCPKVEYVVLLLEFIDIGKDQFKVPQEKSLDIMLPQAKYNQKCMVRASMPRLGFTRGDIVPLKVIIDHFTSFSRKDGVTIDLVRTVEIRTTRHTVFKETVIRSTPYFIDIKSPHYKQTLLCQLSIPTSTPPSIRYKDKVLRFHYKVRVTVSFGGKNNCVLDLPIVVGTWPRAAVPIDDDDDDEGENKYSHDTVLSYDDDDDYYEGNTEEDDIESLRSTTTDEGRTNSGILPSWHTNNSSTSTLTTAHRHSNGGESTLVGRSDSNASKTSNRSYNSVSSWRSSRSWEYNQQNINLTRNTSQITTVSSPDRLPSYYSDSLYPNHHHHHHHHQNINRNSHQYQRPLVYPQTNRSVYSSSSREETESDVPTHILEPLPNHFIPLTSPIHEQQEPHYSTTYLSSSEDDSDDDDDGDLLAIIKRKERKERKQQLKNKES
ncbi:hypothetical protein HPULCUR_011768 [Helicostylum pulchrum]|uniref:Arrestin C-terminal-like domain-containing protein n=1 Tax=Helicostylum pulchrum TaxID=562976 RepID=A0ABP9YH12_9FUNG